MDRSESNGWTVQDWEKWSNDLAEMLPPEADGDEDQETIIARWLAAAATYGEQLEAVGEELDRWESETRLTARGVEHLERMRNILEGESL